MLRHGALIRTDPVFTPQGIYTLSRNSDSKEVIAYIINVVKEELKGAGRMPVLKALFNQISRGMRLRRPQGPVYFLLLSPRAPTFHLHANKTAMRRTMGALLTSLQFF